MYNQDEGKKEEDDDDERKNFECFVPWPVHNFKTDSSSLQDSPAQSSLLEIVMRPLIFAPRNYSIAAKQR